MTSPHSEESLVNSVHELIDYVVDHPNELGRFSPAATLDMLNALRSDIEANQEISR